MDSAMRPPRSRRDVAGKLAEIGAIIRWPDGPVYGVVKRATSRRVWTEHATLVAGCEPGELIRVGDARGLRFYVEGSPAWLAHQQRRALGEELRVTADYARDEGRRLGIAVHAAMRRRAGEGAQDWALRVEKTRAAVLAALEADASEVSDAG